MNAPCPVCSTASRPVETYTPQEAASHFCPPHRDADRYRRLVDAVSALWPEGTCSVHRCPECGFGFGVPYVGGDDAFYGVLHEQMGYPDWRWDYDVAAAELAKGPVGRVLDIGAGSGAFLSSLGSDVERFAVESSPLTLQALADRGIAARPELCAFGPEDDGSFDAVTLFQVLEHIAPPFEVLRECARLLRPGGVLVVTVPEAEAMAAQRRILGAPDMPPNHINRWTRRSLSLAMEAAGLRPGAYLEEPRSLRLIRGKLHLRLLRDAQDPRSLAGLAYRVRSQRVRAALLAGLAPVTLAKLALHLPYLLSGGAFALTAHRPSDPGP